MDRVIPKDVIDLIYKESHLDKIKRLNVEYHDKFCIVINFWGHEILKKKYTHFNLCCRELYALDHYSVFALRNNNMVHVAPLPKKYRFSSGQSKLKWIE